MKKIKRAYILLFVCVMTVCFSGCQNQSNVSSEDVENSLFMEWCSRFRASNEPLILITFPDGTSTALVGENAVTAASDMEKALTALTADDFSVLQDCSASTDAPYIIISDNLTEYKFSPTDNGVIVTGTPDTREDFLSEDELLVINDTDFAKVVDGVLRAAGASDRGCGIRSEATPSASRWNGTALRSPTPAHRHPV